ncbi:MAG: hypothetical protein GYB66_15765 [Chloroflexi bacterium]|nr:hypothetical protein [Chloroflexota bacterium]
MAKRSTTGRARKERDPLTRKQHLSKAERDALWQQRVLIGAGVLGGLMLIALLGALIYDLVIVPEQAVSEVNGQEIKTDDFRRRVRAQRWFLADQVREFHSQTGQLDSGTVNYLDDAETVGTQVLDQMELEILLKEQAEELGVEVDEEAVQSQVDDYIARYTGQSLTPTPTSSPTPVEVILSTPFITATPSHTPAPTSTIPSTALPTIEGCEGEDCATVTPLPSPTASLTPTATPEVTDTPEPSETPLAPDDVRSTVEDFESDLYEDAEDVADVDREIIRDIFYFQALQDALRTHITDEMIANGELADERLSAEARHILIAVPEELQGPAFDPAVCDSEEWAPYREEADEVLAELNAGAPFATLARAVSDDEGSAVQGGRLQPAQDVDATYVPPFAEAIREGEIGEYLGPVCSQFGFHIIQVFDKEWQDIPESELFQARSQAYQEWENDLRDSANIQRRDDWRERIPEEPDVDELLGDLIEDN